MGDERTGNSPTETAEIRPPLADHGGAKLFAGLFVKEVRKPNGSEYAPDTIYYLVLGIQQYLYENGRIDNIFTDLYFETFTNCLDEVARKFSVLYNDSRELILSCGCD